MKILIPLFTLLTLHSQLSTVYPQWCTDPNVNLQVSSWGQYPVVCSDGDGGVYIRWEANSFTTYQYIQRVNKYGYKWPQPVEVYGTQNGTAFEGKICPDDSNGVIVPFLEWNVNGIDPQFFFQPPRAGEPARQYGTEAVGGIRREGEHAGYFAGHSGSRSRRSARMHRGVSGGTGFSVRSTNLVPRTKDVGRRRNFCSQARYVRRDFGGDGLRWGHHSQLLGEHDADDTISAKEWLWGFTLDSNIGETIHLHEVG